MREATSRRYSRLVNEGKELPDLILIDGGIGQVNAVDGVLKSLGLDIPIAGLAKRDEEIWSAVSTFKGMIKNGLVDKLEMRPQPTDNQEIIVEYYGDDIMFRFKNKVSLMTDEEYGIKKTTELEKFVPTSAKILCQTGDTVYDKYTSYIAHKIKEDGKVDEKTTRRLIKLQSEFTSFERSIIDLGGGDKHIEYGNIYLGDLKHAVTSYRLFNDGTDSRITVNIGKSPTLAEIRLIICGIKDLFDLDPETKVILAS